MIPESSVEEELLRRWRQCRSADGRRALLERILEPYLARIVRWSLRFARNPDEASEIAQDALLTVCSRLESFRGEARFSTWLYALVRNHALNRVGRASDRRETSLEDMPPDVDSRTPDGGYDRSQRLRDARSLLASVLTPMEARVFLLHFGLEMPLAAIDRELGLTNRSGARAYLVSAKRKLKRTREGRARRARARRERARETLHRRQFEA